MPDKRAFDDKRKEIAEARARLAEIQKAEGSKSMKFWDAQEALIKLESQHNDLVAQLAPAEQTRYLDSIKEKRA